MFLFETQRMVGLTGRPENIPGRRNSFVGNTGEPGAEEWCGTIKEIQRKSGTEKIKVVQTVAGQMARGQLTWGLEAMVDILGLFPNGAATEGFKQLSDMIIFAFKMITQAEVWIMD